MKFTVRILSGKRAGLESELLPATVHAASHPYFLEDEALEFRLELKAPVDDLYLCLH